MKSTSVPSIRVLRLIRDSKQHPSGDELMKFLRAILKEYGSINYLPQTGALLDREWEYPIQVIKSLVKAGLVEVRHKKEGVFTAERFEKTVQRGGAYAIGNFIFGLSANFELIQEALGITSLRLLENWALGHSISVTPMFETPRNTRLFQSVIFVIMPFAPFMKPVYEQGILSAANELEIACSRADDMFTNRSIISHIWFSIFSSRLVIADCTGRNVNVFYELGIAHTVGKDTIILAQSLEDIPFDIRHLPCIIYEQSEQGLVKLRVELKKAISDLLKAQNS